MGEAVSPLSKMRLWFAILVDHELATDDPTQDQRQLVRERKRAVDVAFDELGVTTYAQKNKAWEKALQELAK